MTGRGSSTALIAAVVAGVALPAGAVGTAGFEPTQGFYLAGMKPDSEIAPSARRPNSLVPPASGRLIDDKTPLKIRLPGKRE